MKHPTQDNEILRYYEAEMRYLREAGTEFAQAYPDRARMLNLDRIGERDPHVERLFEGFDKRIELEHLGVRQSPSATFIDYRVKKA